MATVRASSKHEALTRGLTDLTPKHLMMVPGCCGGPSYENALPCMTSTLCVTTPLSNSFGGVRH